MSTDEYVPSEEELVDGYRRKKVTLHGWTYQPVLSRAEIRRGLARVRRDAARGAEARIEAWEKQYAHDLEQADAHIDAAEARIRDLTQEAKDERGAALDQMEQVKIRDARIKAVEDLCDDADKRHASVLIVTTIRRALDT